MSLYAQQLVRYPELGISLDFSKLPLDDAFLSSMQGRIDRAFADMKALESGAIANPDEKRMVGHYWLRNSALAPTPELKAAIDGPLADVKAFGRDVLDGKITPPRAEQYSAALVIGIGGSALGPELVADAIRPLGWTCSSWITRTRTACTRCWNPCRWKKRSSSSSPNPAARRKPATACWWPRLL